MVFISVKNDRRQSRSLGENSERCHYRRGAIHHPDFCQSPRSRTPGAGRQDEGDPAYLERGGKGGEGDREYVPCVSDFIISVRRNVRHPTKARPRAEEGFNAGERGEGRTAFDEDTAHPVG